MNMERKNHEKKQQLELTKEQARLYVHQTDICHDDEEVVEVIEKQADRYEEFLEVLGYSGPAKCADAVEKLEGDNFDCKILDVGAGTGLVGNELAKRGYRAIDALDASETMLIKAAEKNVYRTIIRHYVGFKPIPLDESSYDIAIACAVFAKNFIPHEAIRDIIRLVRPGGHMIIKLGVFDEEWCNNTFETYLENLEKEQKWRQISRTVHPAFLDDKDGYLYVYEIL